MAKISGGLMSLNASGTIGKAVTFSGWKGTAYARAYTKPANPKSTAQTSTRSVFAFLHSVYKQGPQIFRDPWEASVKGQALTAWNAFTKANLTTLRPIVTLIGMMFSNGAGGGTQPLTVTVTPGAGQLSVACTVPTPPTGWTITGVAAAAQRDQDPHLALLAPMHAQYNAVAPYTNVITGLTANLHRVGVWIKFSKPDGTIAYGASLLSSGTPT